MTKDESKKTPGKEINVDHIDMERMKEKTTDIPALLTYAHSLGGFKIEPTEKGLIKSTALKAMSEQTNSQLDIIYQQMKLLAEQAKKIKDRAVISEMIYQADLNFQPVMGHSYYLYRNKDNQFVVSMISPLDWGKNCPYPSFLAHVKLLSDHTWEVIESSPDWEEI